MHYLSNLLIILHYKSTLIVYELCGSVVIYPQSQHGYLSVWPLFPWEQVLNLKFLTAVMSPQNLIIGLER